MADGQWGGGNPGRPAKAAGSSTLTVEVWVGIPAENRVVATHPLIIRGIRQRAELEMRERPELGEIKIAVRHLAPDAFHPGTDRRRLAAPDSRHRRGAILIYPYRPSAVAAYAQRTKMVSVLEPYDGLEVDSIDTDDTAAVATLVGLLREAGHTRIGFLSWDYPVAGLWVGRRFSGFTAALQAHGLRYQPEWMLNVLPDRPRIKATEAAGLATRLVRESGVTAWVCAADHQAYHLVRSLAEEGIRVPRDCSVTGFDGVEPPAGLPRATSMRVPSEHIGSSALTRLVNRILYPSSPQRKIFVKPQLVAGETMAAPPLA